MYRISEKRKKPANAPSDKNAVYVSDLNKRTQEIIKKAVIRRLRAEGIIKEAEMEEYTNDVMASKIDSLEDTINIRKIILASEKDSCSGKNTCKVRGKRIINGKTNVNDVRREK